MRFFVPLRIGRQRYRRIDADKALAVFKVRIEVGKFKLPFVPHGGV